MKTPPLFLALIVISYVVYSVGPIFFGSEAKDFGYTPISLVVALFAFNGSVIACRVLAFLCAIAAQSVLSAAIAFWKSDIYLSVLAVATAVLLAQGAHYLLFSSAVRKFQGKDVIIGRQP
ncbi:hypothetical protein [Pseudomonas sp. COW5]|uniref:hypothetical protein n=1 Tax=Pseudomonas sp. COW5 TaxID=2981253 RepID=UPI002246DDAE|nr:hypothetical protein [Pseudomonas sp. COW5]MCX2546535.1 hypothetical protein [Pseudomonas sp. COW5]